ncbi:hypothetical protein, partial [Arthrobacter sp. ISL-65]|uniref:hypothetical protein n=1 Tax=Arthrobacter sp. ISL-65 TaxID=2819112 RepID=UPI001BE855F3
EGSVRAGGACGKPHPPFGAKSFEKLSRACASWNGTTKKYAFLQVVQKFKHNKILVDAMRPNR